VPRLCHLFLVSLSTLLRTLSFTITSHPSEHSYLCWLKCHAIFFPYRPGPTSHTTAVQSPSHNQRYIHIGKHWYQLPEFIPSSSNYGLCSCISISICTHRVTKIAKLIHQRQISLALISTLVPPVLITGFKQPLQINDPHFGHTILYTSVYFVYTNFLHLVHCIELLPTPLLQSPHGHLTAFCIKF